MEEDEILTNYPIVDPVVDDTMDTTLAPTDEVITATEEEPIQDTTISLGSFFGTIQECVTITWRYHLKTRKHHIHLALEEFYGRALYDVDNIIEQYQGICGVVEEPFVNTIPGEGKTEPEYLIALKNFVKQNKHILGEHSELDSAIDDFIGHINSTIYKLTTFNENVMSFESFCYENFND